MDQFLNDVNMYAQDGFLRINALQGLLIAAGAAFFLYRWSNIFVVAAGATFVHGFVDVMLPVLAHGAAFRLPQLMDAEYWRFLLTLYVGYLIVISVFYVIKRVAFGGTYRHA